MYQSLTEPIRIFAPVKKANSEQRVFQKSDPGENHNYVGCRMPLGCQLSTGYAELIYGFVGQGKELSRELTWKVTSLRLFCLGGPDESMRPFLRRPSELHWTTEFGL